MSEQTIKELRKEVAALRLDLSMERTCVKMLEDRLGEQNGVRWQRSLDLDRMLTDIREEIGPLTSDGDWTLLQQVRWLCGSHDKYKRLERRHHDDLWAEVRRSKAMLADIIKLIDGRRDACNHQTLNAGKGLSFEVAFLWETLRVLRVRMVAEQAKELKP